MHPRRKDPLDRAWDAFMAAVHRRDRAAAEAYARAWQRHQRLVNQRRQAFLDLLAKQATNPAANSQRLDKTERSGRD